MDLRSKIKSMQEEIRKNIYSLNCGGCIHFAFYFSKRLEELNIPHKIFLGNKNSTKIDVSNFEPVNHVMVYVHKLGYIDGYKTVRFAKLSFRRHVLTNINLNRRSIRNHPNWNSDYDVSQNRLLNTIIKKHINDN